MTRRALLAACALAALAVPQALAATARNGAPIDPRNLIADDLEAEALASYARNAGKAPFKGHEIVVVDYRLPSSARRLYIVDLDTGAVEPHYVAHGRGSDPGHTQVAMRFGDTEGSGMTSIGAYRGLDRYQSPAHGPALRLAGLDRSNASAYERLIVVHTAPYFDPANGKFGRSLGCFVVTVEDRSRVYDVIADEDLCTRAARIGEAIRARLGQIAARQGMECIGDVRGLGAMNAFELVTDRATNAPHAALAAAVVAEAEARGLILLSCGTRYNVIRLLPPLTIPMPQLDEALEIIEAAIEAAAMRRSA